MTLALLSIVLSVLVFSSCAQAQTTRPLQVGLYFPHPDVSQLIAPLTRFFTAQHPDIPVNITIFTGSYDLNLTKRVVHAGQYDVLEIDATLLKPYITMGIVQPITLKDAPAFFPETVKVTSYQGKNYASPTFVVGNFIYSDLPIHRYDDGNRDLTNYLEEQSAKYKKPAYAGLSMVWSDEWSLAGDYCDAYVDTYGPGSMNDCLKKRVDDDVVNFMRRTLDLCKTWNNNSNPCFTNDWNQNILMYAQNRTLAGGTYGKTLYSYVRAGLPNPYEQNIISAPIGRYNNPIMYVDASVMSAALTGTRKVWAQKFIDWYSSLNTLSYISLGKDLYNTTMPRYIAPARKAFYDLPAVKCDKFYQTIGETHEKAVGLPLDFYYDKDRLNRELCKKFNYRFTICMSMPRT